MKKLLIILFFYPFISISQTVPIGIGYPDSLSYLRWSNESENFYAPPPGTIFHVISDGLSSNPSFTIDAFRSGILGSFFRGRAASGTTGDIGPALVNMTLVGLGGDGYGTSSFTGGSVGSVSIKAEANFTNTSKPSYILFNTTPTGSVSSTERLRIKSTGVVNISGLNSTGFVQTNSSGDLSTSSLTSNQVTTALGYTPEPIVTSTTGTVTNVPTLVTSTTVLASNSSRKGCFISCVTGTILISLSTTNSATQYTKRLTTNTDWQVPDGYTGVIKAIGAGTLIITELQ